MEESTTSHHRSYQATNSICVVVIRCFFHLLRTTRVAYFVIFDCFQNYLFLLFCFCVAVGFSEVLALADESESSAYSLFCFCVAVGFSEVLALANESESSAYSSL